MTLQHAFSMKKKKYYNRDKINITQTLLEIIFFFVYCCCIVASEIRAVHPAKNPNSIFGNVYLYTKINDVEIRLIVCWSHSCEYTVYRVGWWPTTMNGEQNYDVYIFSSILFFFVKVIFFYMFFCVINIFMKTSVRCSVYWLM